jgi:hypothetical protein
MDFLHCFRGYVVFGPVVPLIKEKIAKGAADVPVFIDSMVVLRRDVL